MKLTVLYRGPLSSCNYGCEYCPFGKWKHTDEELAKDRADLERFLAWVEARTGDTVSVFFTPWGEALIWPWYQQALARLTHLPHVERVAAQTNLSCKLDWVKDCRAEKLGIWATYHPEWMKRRRFVAQCEALTSLGVRHSAGMVGFLRFAEEAEALRRELSDDTYLWINAVKDGQEEPYSPEDVARFTAVDPLFPVNNVRHPSLGRACRGGESVISVDGEGTARRCHFIDEPIGNIYAPDFDQSLRPRPCAKTTCGCHIGYVHMDYLELDRVFGSGILERVPVKPLWRRQDVAPRVSPRE
ncbi:radical SAM protein [Myxococcus llanfairpwllgwyngyllgogerychwyrndrobwllllantysiliogogogochensis]|uniref:Radical SAM protein n=1 Tax=Myxococcus llanfairpwllgwyngyllgogerychwyrndrobwllllantysiliogogogochensis TaxID=2590453 RepID=A0A540WVV6_9BACT|nr:STM4011 family radical SAM protein [Myxococcus llanfairpwllgwyngyllgogerychwyrndrobwllllantysiliogogogochensis]TQF13107.1 radical SAM protein [Myxococcus llanfairpwllgwyngyllgogerychwyrndrobwllllantysiliogogogochensis]